MRGEATLALALGAALFGAACGGGESAADREAATRGAEADSVKMAESLYDPAVFDTIKWESEAARLERGQTVWRFSCQKCHGPDGRGGGEFAQQAHLDVPSFRIPDWAYDDDMPAIRHRIFVGHEGAMPNWGLHGLKYRDIDAAAAYINEVVRGHATGDEPGG